MAEHKKYFLYTLQVIKKNDYSLLLISRKKKLYWHLASRDPWKFSHFGWVTLISCFSSYRTWSWPRWTTKTWTRTSHTLQTLWGKRSPSASPARSLWVVCTFLLLLWSPLFLSISAQLKTWPFTSGTTWWRFCRPACSMRSRFTRRIKTSLHIEESRCVRVLYAMGHV